MDNTERKKIGVITKIMNDATFTCKELAIAFKKVATGIKPMNEVIKHGKEREENKSEKTGEGYSRNSSRR
jgi:phage-related protein